MTESPPEPTRVPLTPIRTAVQDLLFAAVLVAMGWGVVWLIEWAERAPSWIALIYMTLGPQGVIAVFGLFAVFVALEAPGHLAEGGWHRSAVVLRLAVLGAVIAQAVRWFGTDHRVLGVLCSLLAIIVALIVVRDSRAADVPRATMQPKRD
ncbi:MAG TPA: hypothetical protein VIX73_20545 [Kofleriaceae bacterium]|jgi:hypothetical protein